MTLRPTDPLYKIPTVLRRLLAEAFDTFLIQVVKVLVLFLVMNNTSLM
jgi:hypothetical protein